MEGMKMRTTYLKVVLVALAVVAVACKKNNDSEISPEGRNRITLTCAYPALNADDATKVMLSPSSGVAQWQVGDKIVIFGKPSSSSSARVVHEIVAEDITDPTVAVFSVDLNGLTADSDCTHDYNVAYPYTEGQQFYYSSGYGAGRARFQNTNQVLLAGYIDGTSIVLNNITAAIAFKVDPAEFDSFIFKGANGDEVVGYTNLLVEMNSSDAPKYRQKYNESNGSAGPQTSISADFAADGSAIVFLPVNNPDTARGANQVSLPNGFTIQLIKDGVVTKYITSTAAVTLSPGHIINLGMLPSESMHDYVVPTTHSNTIGVDMSTATDLSASATANCYIVDGSVAANAGASFKFKAAKGKGGAVLTTINTDDDANDVVVLWETKNTSTAPEKGDIIAAVDYDLQSGDDAYIVFKMPATITPGNALIAAKDAGDNILWSWHIWIPATSVEDINDAAFFGKVVMDRNLGAIEKATSSAAGRETYGMYYQWGRSTPLPGPVKATATITATNGPKSTAFAIANPTVFIQVPEKDENGNWNEEDLPNLWEDGDKNKEIFDPCPSGYKVPSYSSSTGLWVNGNDGWTYNWTNNNFAYGSIVFPMAGWYSSGASISYEGARSIILSATAHSAPRARLKIIRQDKSGYYYANYFKEEAASVRCVAE